MKKFEEWYFPDGERHLPEWMTKTNDRWMGRLAYQGKKQRAAISLVPVDKRAMALDIGAHVGLWSYYLARFFKSVHAFEPIAAHRECFVKNVPECEEGGHVHLHPYALGDETGTVGFHTEPTSSGDTYVNGKGDIPVRRLDDVAEKEGIADVGFIKLDCEGYEYFALHGGEQLMVRDRPVIIVEQKPGKAQKFGLAEQHAVDYLISLGMKLHSEMGGDFFMTWRQ